MRFIGADVIVWSDWGQKRHFWGQIIETSPTRTNQSFVMVSNPSQVRPSPSSLPPRANTKNPSISLFLFSEYKNPGHLITPPVGWGLLLYLWSVRARSECQKLINKYGSCYQTLFSVVTSLQHQGRFCWLRIVICEVDLKLHPTTLETLPERPI